MLLAALISVNAHALICRVRVSGS